MAQIHVNRSAKPDSDATTIMLQVDVEQEFALDLLSPYSSTISCANRFCERAMLVSDGFHR
jgi:hypothetical protein